MLLTRFNHPVKCLTRTPCLLARTNCEMHGLSGLLDHRLSLSRDDRLKNDPLTAYTVTTYVYALYVWDNAFHTLAETSDAVTHFILCIYEHDETFMNTKDTPKRPASIR